MPPPETPVILVRWEQVLGDLLDRTQRFPKVVRFTFSGRIDNLGLDVLQLLVRARWAGPAEKAALLREVDSGLACLRALLRLSHERRYLDSGGYEHVMRGLDEVGRMVGGWQKDVSTRADS